MIVLSSSLINWFIRIHYYNLSSVFLSLYFWKEEHKFISLVSSFSSHLCCATSSLDRKAPITTMTMIVMRNMRKMRKKRKKKKQWKQFSRVLQLLQSLQSSYKDSLRNTDHKVRAQQPSEEELSDKSFQLAFLLRCLSLAMALHPVRAMILMILRS